MQMRTSDVNRIIQELTDRLRTDSSRSDPVRHCDVYKTEGCTHVDGFLCNMETCDILQKYRDEKNKEG
jgi:hypothetical protein